MILSTSGRAKPFDGLGREEEAIRCLDLEPIKGKLTAAKEGQGWTQAQADLAECWYKRYLILIARYPDCSVVPNKIIDTVWHTHILDTRKYAVDCQAIFGRFLHHFPYFGMRGPDDARRLSEAFEHTKQLFLLHFGEALSTLEDFFASNNYNLEIASAEVKRCTPTGHSLCGGDCSSCQTIN